MAIYEEDKLLPPGEYKVEVTDASLAWAATKRSEMVVVTVKAKNEDDGSSPFRDYLVLSAGARWKFKSFLKAIGIKLNEGQEIDSDVVQAFVGAKARAKVGIREFNGDEQNFVERWIRNADPDETNGPSAQ